ncbi:MAG: sulfotransferase domain-containing protein, partial [Planctomycetota bacterium]|jgi:hypothetical protein
VQKAATSWLFSCLAEHPEIRIAIVPNNKELNFFNQNYARGYAWYHRRFELGPWKTGEYSPSYFYDRNVPERIYRYNPRVKLILSLRNPIERAFSQHLHEIRRNRLPPQLYRFSEALEQNLTYTEQGMYASHLERYLKFFDLSQIHIILFDEIKFQHRNVIRELFNFLGVNATFVPSLVGKRTNVAHRYRNISLQILTSTVSRLIRICLGESFLNMLKATKLPAIVRRYNEMEFDESVVPGLSEDERRHLQSIFAEEIRRLGILIDRDLSHWQ